MDILSTIDLPSYESIYKHLHAHPELSNLESQTSAFLASHLSSLPGPFTLKTSIGGHGLVGILHNGAGKTILLRADMDALPILEATGLPYASTVGQFDASGAEQQPVMHACGHDMHMTCLLAAAEVLVKRMDDWSGTLVVLFQPAEERGTGARAMVDDGLYDPSRHACPIPDFVLGQHVMAMRAGSVGSKRGVCMAGADSLKVKLFGVGGHGSQPHRTVDPVVLAAHVVVRLQSVVSREINPADISVLTVGSLRAGQTENIIPDFAEIGIDVRSVRPETREKLLAAIRRVVRAECEASGCTREAEFVVSRHLPNTENDVGMMGVLERVFEGHFGRERYDGDIPTTTISEDFSVLGTAVGRPCAFWHWGGIEEEFWDRKVQEGRVEEDVPANHTARFAPVIQPTMRTGVEALVVAALAFFKGEGGSEV
ncbi:amidohydrolase [Coniochaeta sp. 2T2.1]|nr:amidohydrolase [Coniochaeta sp. 2T2.1]